MRKGVIIGLFLVLSLFSFTNVFAAGCDLKISMVNQDPYPAIPGEEAKVVFQIDGLENSLCGRVQFELLETYPITLSPEQQASYSIESGTFTKNYQSFFLAPFKIRIAENALDGDNALEVRYKYGTNFDYVTKELNLYVADILADFEIHVKDYDSTTRTIIFEILNIAKSDIQALTVEVPKQDNIEVKGSKVNIVGDLDSQEYTTADFEAIPSKGEINLMIAYTDSTNQRRTIEKTVLYEPEYFEGRIADQKPNKTGSYIFYALILVVIGYLIYRRNKKKKAAKNRR